MAFYLRRILFGLGAVLLVLGWGMTRYADAELTALASGESEAVHKWVGEKVRASRWANADSVSGKNLYAVGIVCMTIGAGVVVGAFPRVSWQAHGP